MSSLIGVNNARSATAGKARALPRFWVSIRSYKKQPVKKSWGRILCLAWLKFLVTHLIKYALGRARTTKSLLD